MIAILQREVRLNDHEVNSPMGFRDALRQLLRPLLHVVVPLAEDGFGAERSFSAVFGPLRLSK
jgi:hypothetical protein